MLLIATVEQNAKVLCRSTVYDVAKSQSSSAELGSFLVLDSAFQGLDKTKNLDMVSQTLSPNSLGMIKSTNIENFIQVITTVYGYLCGLSNALTKESLNSLEDLMTNSVWQEYNSVDYIKHFDH